MSTLQISLMVLAIIATLYQLTQIGNVTGTVSYYGHSRILLAWYAGMLGSIVCQVLFVLSLTGNIS